MFCVPIEMLSVYKNGGMIMLQILNKTDKLRAEWTIRKVINNYKSGVSVFDNAVQRGLVWDIEKKSRLIRSTILDRPIPPIYASKHDEIYSNLDGKQRSHTYVEFYNDEFSLEGLDPITVMNTETGEEEDIDINGMCFSELPQELQDAITDATITVIVINNASEDDECEIFYDLNNGKPLNAFTIARTKAKSRKEITMIGSHEIFKNALTKKALEKYTNEDIVVKSWMILNQEAPSLTTASMRKVMETVILTEKDIEQLNKCFDRVLEMHNLIDDKKIAKRTITRTHMISIMRLVWRSIQENKTSEQMANWFSGFFCGNRPASINETYNSCAGAGSASVGSISTRLEILNKNYEDFFKDGEIESEHETQVAYES